MDRGHEKDFVLTDYAKNLIKFKAHQLSRRRGFTPSDQSELQQQLWTSVVQAADQFDPAKSSLNTFIDRVVNSAVAMILRGRRRKKRADGFHAQSLDEPVQQNGHAEPLGASVSDADRGRRTGTVPPDETARREDEEAVAHALQQMPEYIRDVCRRVMGGSISSAARELGTSRRQIRKALAKAQPYVERAGFGDD